MGEGSAGQVEERGYGKVFGGEFDGEVYGAELREGVSDYESFGGFWEADWGSVYSVEGGTRGSLIQVK